MRRLVLLAAGSLFSVCLSASAEPVTYTLAGYYTGTLGSESFYETYGVFSMTGDTTNTVPSTVGHYFYNDAGVSTFTLTGYGTATFTSPTFGVFSQYNNFLQNDAAGFLDQDTVFGVGIASTAFAGYALGSYIGPVNGIPNDNSQYAEPTSLGALTITGADFTKEYSFSAVPAAVPSSVTPEPASIALLGTGLLGTLGAVRKRRA